MQEQDSLHTTHDTIAHISATHDSIAESPVLQGNTVDDTIPKPVQIKTTRVPVRDSVEQALPIIKTAEVIPGTVKETPKPADTVIQIQTEPVTKLYTLFRPTTSKFDFKKEPVWTTSHELSAQHSFARAIDHKFHRSQLNWSLLLALVCTVLLLIVRLHSKNMVNKVLNTLVNVQLADTILREKNVITRQAFFMLNTIFIIVFSLFILLLSILFKFPTTGKYFIDYLIIFGGFTGILIIRLVLYYTVGFIFEWLPATTQQVHISYLVNKNLGLILLPVVFAAIYSTPVLSEIIIYFGIILVFFAALYKTIRGFQIIIRNGVLLFYAILYLCTLEFLPVLVGVKLITLLR